MRNSDEWTTISIRKTTRDRLKKKGKKGESYDAILWRLSLDVREKG